MLYTQSKLIPGKNIALSGVGYWPKPVIGYKFKTWLIRWLLKILAAIILLVLCSLVETSRLLTVKTIAKTASEVLIEDGVSQAFPVGFI